MNPCLWLVPLGVYSLPVLPDPPGLLHEIPDGVEEIIEDVANDVDDADEQSKQRVEKPAVGHVSASNGAHLADDGDFIRLEDTTRESQMTRETRRKRQVTPET